jgi:hypothetical protein
MKRFVLFCLTLSIPLAAHAGNIQDTDLITSNTFFLPPSAEKSIFVQARNSSDNQGMSLTDLASRLTAKGYVIVQDPDVAHYVVLANIVYCNITKPEMPVEAMVASGYGSGLGSSVMGGLSSLTSVASMAGPQGAVVGAAASMGLSAIQGIGSAVGSLFSGPSKPTMPDDVNYACVADLQVSEQGAIPSVQPADNLGLATQPGIFQMRLGADVHQKKLDEAEATPLLQQKLSAAVAGNF